MTNRGRDIIGDVAEKRPNYFDRFVFPVVIPAGFLALFSLEIAPLLPDFWRIAIGVFLVLCIGVLEIHWLFMPQIASLQITDSGLLVTFIFVINRMRFSRSLSWQEIDDVRYSVLLSRLTVTNPGGNLHFATSPFPRSDVEAFTEEVRNRLTQSRVAGGPGSA